MICFCVSLIVGLFVKSGRFGSFGKVGVVVVIGSVVVVVIVVCSVLNFICCCVKVLGIFLMNLVVLFWFCCES